MTNDMLVVGTVMGLALGIQFVMLSIQMHDLRQLKAERELRTQQVAELRRLTQEMLDRLGDE